ncbi:tellurite resistance protein TehA-like permease [Arthrobacter globiformis]|nr:tellurite resistance protein TehA-like permease [Arthrobacter globiformis]
MACIAALAIVAAQLLAHWVTGGVSMESIHPGYLLPVVPGSFVASIGFSSIHAHDAAMAAFGVGAFFWLVVGTVVTVRLMTGAEVPPAALPGREIYGWTILGLATSFTLVIAARTAPKVAGLIAPQSTEVR